MKRFLCSEAWLETFRAIIVLLCLSGLISPVFFSQPTPIAKAAVAQRQTVPTPPQPASRQQPQSFREAPRPVRGVYITSWTAGSGRMKELTGFLKENGLNAVVIDVKDDTGVVSYQTQVDLARKCGAASRRIADPSGLLAGLRAKGILAIARIVAFKDPLLAGKRPDLAFKAKAGGSWRDRKGQSWVSPYSQEVWEYLTALGKEAIQLGFSEVQYDYVRFPSDGNLSQLVYPEGRPVSKQIGDFLRYATAAIHSCHQQAVVSADTFGLAGSAVDDLGIGQKIQELDGAADYLSPMAYPSHYAKGTYALSNPNAAPYQTVKRSIGDHQKLVQKSKLRPWLQAFTLGPPAYGPEHLRLQLKALRELGVAEFLLWNPASRYGVFAGAVQ